MVAAGGRQAASVQAEAIVQNSSSVSRGCSWGGERGYGEAANGAADRAGIPVEISESLLVHVAGGVESKHRFEGAPWPRMEAEYPLSWNSLLSCGGSPFSRGGKGIWRTDHRGDHQVILSKFLTSSDRTSSWRYLMTVPLITLDYTLITLALVGSHLQ